MTRKTKTHKTSKKKVPAQKVGRTLPFLLLGGIALFGISYYVSNQPETATSTAIVKPQPKPETKVVQPNKEIITHTLKLNSREPRKLNIPAYVPPQEIERKQRWKDNAVKVKATPDKAKIVIIIDDVGMNYSAAKELIEIKEPLTMAFLPYARNVDKLAKASKEAGQELMIHMPMEPMDGDLDTGSINLKTSYSSKEFDSMMDKAFAAFDGYVGLNNHMGSKFTQDPESMRRLMDRLYQEGMLFVDSRTIHTSVAEKTANDFLVPNIARDVFIDHDPSAEGVRKSLEKVESVARKHGLVVAIGHPKTETIKALKEWIPTLESKGMVLVPVSAVVKTPQNN